MALSQQDFVRTYGPLADDIAGHTGMDSNVVLGLLANESAWGNHFVGNNPFGISPGGNVAGYPSVGDAGKAFADLINSKYVGVAGADDQAAALVKGGYNTADPQWANKVRANAAAIKALRAQAAPSGADDRLKELRGIVPGGGQAAPAPDAGALDDADARLKELRGIVPGAPAETPPPVPLDRPPGKQPDTFSEETGLPMPQPAPSPALERIVNAAREGYEGSPSLLTPEARAYEDQYILGHYIYNPLASLAGGALGVLGGAFRGGQQAVQEALTPISPQLGRDVAAIPEAFAGEPNALIPPRSLQSLVRENALLRPGEGWTPEANYVPNLDPLDPSIVQGGWNARRGLAEEVAPASPVPPEPQPAVGPPLAAEDRAWVGNTRSRIDDVVRENAAAGGPSSLSAAATPPADAAMSPALNKSYRRMSELNQIVSPIEGKDTTAYVPGSIPTEAEAEGNPATSQKEVLTRQRAPDQFEGPNGRLTANNAARINAFDDLVMTDPQAAALKEEQQAAAGRDQTRILTSARPVNLQPAANWINEKLADPLIQEDSYVYNNLRQLRDTLYDADGNLKTDPRAAWGMHNNLRNKLLDAKSPLSANPSEKYSLNQTNDFKKMIDGALNDASDGQFQQYLDSQSEYLKRLNANDLLTNFRNKGMLNRQGQINANAFHKFVTDMGIRRGKPGIDAAMDIPDDTMQTLINIDQDLKRAGRIDLGKPRGSPTNLYFELAKGLGIAGAHSIVGAMTGGTPFGGIANLGLQTGISAFERMAGRRNLNKLVNQALTPPANMPPAPGNYPDALQP